LKNEMMLVWVLLGIIGTIVLIAIIISFAEWFTFFKKELRHLNLEIARTDGSEKEHWKKRKKRLLLSIIPFFRY